MCVCVHARAHKHACPRIIKDNVGTGGFSSWFQLFLKPIYFPALSIFCSTVSALKQINPLAFHLNSLDFITTRIAQVPQ